LHDAALTCRVSVAELLIDKGANVDAKQKSGYTPLFIATAMDQTAMAKLLRRHGANE
jgi:ankyrin repeat protein